MADLDQRIADMQAALDAMLEEKDNVRRYLDDTTTVLYPVRCVPSEVLVEIVFHFVEDALSNVTCQQLRQCSFVDNVSATALRNEMNTYRISLCEAERIRLPRDAPSRNVTG